MYQKCLCVLGVFPFFVCGVGCNESDAILRDAVYERLDWRWRRQGKVGELRKEGELDLTECDRRKMTGFGPGIRMQTTWHAPAYTLTHKHTQPWKSGYKHEGTIWSVPANTNQCLCGSIFKTHTHTYSIDTQTHGPNQLGFLRRGQNKVNWVCKWLSQHGCDSQDSCY